MSSEQQQFTVTSRHRELATVAEGVINTEGTKYKISPEAVAGWVSLFDRSNLVGQTLADLPPEDVERWARGQEPIPRELRASIKPTYSRLGERFTWLRGLLAAYQAVRVAEGAVPTAHGRAWMVRGRKGLEEHYAVTRGFVMHGWDWLPDSSNVWSPDDIAVLLARHDDYRDSAPGSVTKHARELYAFTREIEIDDLAVYPLVHQPGLMMVGRVIGPYEYRTDLAPDTRHVRRVTWLGPAVRRHGLSDSLQGELRYRGTVRALSDDAAQELHEATSRA